MTTREAPLSPTGFSLFLTGFLLKPGHTLCPEYRYILAYRRYSLDYVEEEAEAQAARRGIWASEFVKPWEWRRGKRLDTGD